MGPRAVSNSLWEVYLEAKAQMNSEQDEKYLEALGDLVRAFEDDSLTLVQSIIAKEYAAEIHAPSNHDGSAASQHEATRYNEIEADSCRLPKSKSSKPNSLT